MDFFKCSVFAIFNNIQSNYTSVFGPECCGNFNSVVQMKSNLVENTQIESRCFEKKNDGIRLLFLIRFCTFGMYFHGSRYLL